MNHFFPKMLMINSSETELLNVLHTLVLMITIYIIVDCLLGWKFRKAKHAVIGEPRIQHIGKLKAIIRIQKVGLIILTFLLLLLSIVALTQLESGIILLQALMLALVACSITIKIIILHRWRSIITTSSSPFVTSAYFWLKIFQLTDSILQIPIILLTMDTFTYVPYIFQ
ncbi:hypothetical protein [Lactiplantibacillus fabifermentans]|uniref:Uncharacterized protein n=1 Tax=Lactiplantibacillus fabifermentans T30PCM01 TaxID=1400520 RepID=W6TA00_9LACO|nr:hypothetical protein [Lactiplantibacillus fabifermentans]ETY75361.1 hypothetical protein LFAB_02455 [Lactiplantibacillus fabifermentans T30PCM01]